MKTSDKSSRGAVPVAANEEAGATDNQLILDVNDKRWQKKVAGLTEGDTVTFEISARMTGPGQFAVEEIMDCQSDGGDEEDEGEEEAPKPKGGGEVASKGITNPAIVALIGSKR